MVEDENDDEKRTEEDRAEIRTVLPSLDQNHGVPMEDILADFGLTMAGFEAMAAEPISERPRA